ncbi:Cna B-type domain-containing protein [Alloscardovia sp. HMSC034E08]|uniref:Cna B-type domain-containing protein n=1 Tax=Alloscardovia sp. HMSC034E08 TaxID=1739413 RepID=UPI00143C248F|nr:Cna B-type domain-containing protein [Alloscardovia sp. HMSC034E08]
MWAPHIASILLIGMIAVLAIPSIAHAQEDRLTFDMSQDAPGQAGQLSALESVLSQIGTTPATIILDRGSYNVDKTLKIPAGADIEFKNYQGDDSDSAPSFVRHNDFKGVMIQVEEGAKLTLSGNTNEALELNGGGESAKSESAILLIQGSVTINHATIKDANGIEGTFNGAVKVDGVNASLTMNEGVITDNKRHSDTQSNMYGAANVIVDNRARFVMNGGSIKNGTGSGGVTTNAYGDTGGVLVAHGASFEMNGGKIKNNKGFAGGLNVWNWVYGSTINSWKKAGTLEQQAENTRSTAVINGGTISGNTAGFGGGGILVFGNAAVEMNGGEISGNSAPRGGGVNAMNLWTWGDSYHNETDGEGGSSGLTRDEYSKYIPGGFRMRGGKITGNYGQYTGGGVNVVSNGVVLEAGEIANNRSTQGGGVYVATRSYAAHLYNALVENNKATGLGGGIWTCPTGLLELHITRGAAINNNTASGYGDDIAHSNYGAVGAQVVTLADRALGGAPISYYYDNKEARFDANNPGEQVILRGEENDTIMDQGLHSVLSEDGINAARSAARLRITGNSGYLGGGLGTNGTIIFGEPDSTRIDLTKKWVYKFNQRSKVKKVPADKIPVPQIDVILGTKNGEKITPIQTVTLKPDNQWKYSFENLPKTDAHGNAIVYTVYEADENGNPTVVATADPKDPTAMTLRNEVMPTTDVKATKVWSGDYEVSSSRPTIFFKLFRSVESGQPEAVPNVQNQELKPGVTEVSWAGLDKYDAQGHQYTFSVREVNAEGENFTPQYYTKTENGLTVTNIYVPPTEPKKPNEPKKPRKELSKTGVSISSIAFAVVVLMGASLAILTLSQRRKRS